MEIQEVLNIVKAFFDAILKVFAALGLVKGETEGDKETSAAA